MSLIGEKSPERALQAFVAAKSGANESLDSLAYKLGVSRIIEQKMPFEGGLFRLAHGELVIKLNIDSPFVRKRFTLAHEIGHLFLETVPALRSTRRLDAALERTCDLIAAELLMPTAAASDFVRGLGPPSPEKLREIASKYRVSLQTAAIRVRDGLKIWKCSMGMWAASPKSKTLWFTGLRRWQYAQPSLECVELALNSNASVCTVDRWERADFTERVWLNLLRVGSSCVLGLVDSAKDSKLQKTHTRSFQGQAPRAANF